MPAWSHDGRHIALVARAASGARTLFVMNADGSALRAREVGIPNVAWPSWSPDDTRIAFSGGDYIPRIWIVGVRGGNPVEVARDGVDPAWSPGGFRIAYTHVQEIDPEAIYLVNPDGTGARAIVASVDGPSSFAPSWSPDGERVVFATAQGPDGGSGSYGLAVTRGYGNGMRYVLQRGRPGEPAWSPRGDEIAFADADGISLLHVKSGTTTFLRRGTSPAWSPDGRKIAFQRGGAIYVMNRDGSAVRELLRRGAAARAA